MTPLPQTISGLQEVLVTCPCCGEVFRLLDAKLIFPELERKVCDFLELKHLEKDLDAQNDRQTEAEQLFAEQIKKKQERITLRVRKRAKNKIRKIDPTFSGNNVDPQDVRVLFHPVEFVVFHGMNAPQGVTRLEFVSRRPQNEAEEAITSSIHATIQNGNLAFETIHMNDDGSLEISKA